MKQDLNFNSLPVKFPIISFAMQVVNYTSDTYLTSENNIYFRYEFLYCARMCVYIY